MHAAERNDAGNPSPGTHDHLPADLLAQDAVRGADAVTLLGRDRRGLQAEAVLANRLRGLVDDLVLARAPGLQREVEPREFEVEPGHLGSQDAEALLEQLLPGFVALEHHDRFGVHGSGH